MSGVADPWELDIGTNWSSDGAVVAQAEYRADGTWYISDTPPWLWNVTDQTAPSMPAWMKDDEKWLRALDAQD